MDVRALTTYVAEDRRQAAALGHELPVASHGAVLFADIVGFTPLTNALSRVHGPRRGAELLTAHLNVVYDALIDAVDRFAGSVIDFSGDAVLCWFDDLDDGEGARRAVTAGREMVAAIGALAPIDVDDTAHVTQVKVAVASGEGTRFACGDPSHRRVDVLAGAPVGWSAAVEKAARPGELVLDDSVLVALGPDVDVSELRQGDDRKAGVCAVLRAPAVARPWPPVHAPSALAEWVDHRLRDRADEEVTELRPAVALFVRLGAFEFATDEDRRRLDEIVRSVQAILHEFDGNLIQVTVGDKGNYLYVAFGAPTAHDDLADRAVGAALELRDTLPGLGLAEQPAIGIDVVSARVGAYGAATRRTYGVLGDGTNMAARLMGASRPGEILVTDAVRAGTKERLIFEHLAPIRVKGRDEPLPVARLVGRPIGTAARSFGDLVGRRAELDRIVSALSAVREGPAGAVLIEGEPGVGKSHLVDAARRRLDVEAGATWLTVGAEGARRGSLAPFLPLMRDLFYQELADDEDARRALFDHGVDARLEELRSRGDTDADALATTLDADRSYLAAVLGLRSAGSPFEHHDPASRLGRVLRTVDAYFRAESTSHPLLVHVRDAHLLDEPSAALVDLLVRSAGRYPMGIVIDRRPDGRELAISEERTVRLGPIGRDDLATMVTLLTGAPAVDAVHDYVWERTNGNALFVEQLVVDLHRRGGLIVDESGVAELVGLDHEVPATLDAVLASRLDHLPAVVRRTAQAASVLGVTFDPLVLAAMVEEVDGIDASEAIAGADSAGLWSTTADGRAVFRHALLRDAAYSMLVEENRRMWHRAAARAVARSMRADDAEIAHHLERAGAPRRAAAVYRRVARASAAGARLRDASERYGDAIRLADGLSLTPPTLVALYDEAATTAAALGDHATAAGWLERLDRAVSEHDARVVEWKARLGEALDRLGRPSDAAAAFEAAIVALQEHPDVRAASRIYAGLAMVHLRSEELDEAYDLADLALAFSAGDAAAEARARHHLGVIEWRRGRLTEAAAHNDAALVACDTIGDRRARAAVLNTAGLIHGAEERHDDAIAAFREAVDGFDLAGDEHGLARALDNLAEALVGVGAREEAMMHLERAVEILARIGMGPDGVVTAMWQSGSW